MLSFAILVWFTLKGTERIAMAVTVWRCASKGSSGQCHRDCMTQKKKKTKTQQQQKTVRRKHGIHMKEQIYLGYVCASQA